MKIRYCPNCVELVHFEPDQPIQRCWNCRRISNFGLVTAPEVRAWLWMVAQVSAVAQRLLAPLDAAAQRAMPALPRNAAFAKFLLVAAVPVVATMLLVCNSFDVDVVHDPTLPFTLP